MSELRECPKCKAMHDIDVIIAKPSWDVRCLCGALLRLDCQESSEPGCDERGYWFEVISEPVIENPASSIKHPVMNEASLPPSIIEDVAPKEDAPRLAPVILDDDGDTSSVAARGEQEREIAFAAAPFTWQGNGLLPFTFGRECDFLLHRALVNAPSLDLVINRPSAFLLDAARILYLCSHPSSEWTGKLGAPLDAAVLLWAETHIPPGTQNAAIELAQEIFERSRTNRPVIKPEPRGKGSDGGNSQAPA